MLPRRVLHAEGLRAIDLELLVGGLPCIDVDDWRLNTGGTLMSDGEHAQLRDWFWRSVDGMDLERRAKLLALACGTGRLPAAGFSALRAWEGVRSSKRDWWEAAAYTVSLVCGSAALFHNMYLVPLALCQLCEAHSVVLRGRSLLLLSGKVSAWRNSGAILRNYSDCLLRCSTRLTSCGPSRGSPSASCACSPTR